MVVVVGIIASLDFSGDCSFVVDTLFNIFGY
jgi:hypothetical protein